MYHIAIDVMHHVHIFLDALYIYEYISAYGFGFGSGFGFGLHE